MTRFLVCFTGSDGFICIASHCQTEREAWEYIKAQKPDTQGFYFILATIKP